MRTSSSRHFFLASTAALLGCAAEPAEHTIESAATCPVVDTRSLLENDPAIVTDARFSLERVFTRIRETTPQNRTLKLPSTRTMFAQLFDAFGTCQGAGVDPRGYGLACRTAEQALGAQDPFTGSPDALHFAPVALVNRFDLAGKTSSTCGESRIVYWKDRGPGTGTAGFIVELSTPPVHTQGRRTCAPIVEFWADLSNDDDATSRAAKLEKFFFEGLPGMPYAPVSAHGAGWAGLGQLRSNNFVDGVQWNLREAKWQKVCGSPIGGGCEARFVIASTKGSPSDRLFAGTHPLASEFQSWFVEHGVPKLARVTDVTALSLGAPSQYLAYESISQPKAGDPNTVRFASIAAPALRDAVSARLGQLGSALTADDIFNRATATTCAGCHRVSNNANLGSGMVFPPSKAFAHVGAAGVLSPSMTDVELPARVDAFQALVCRSMPAVAETAPSDVETIEGRLIGEHH